MQSVCWPSSIVQAVNTLPFDDIENLPRRRERRIHAIRSFRGLWDFCEVYVQHLSTADRPSSTLEVFKSYKVRGGDS
jgi:hypothetical protein